ncbi:FecR family protein [Sphingobacterium sp. SYP-B4668]|uniref:FecR family protein n=1 Tax=Sphingobacterium sp. SYP-B4668 TaxID=2996035 RepID=UPI0022DD7548|nr:FecR family protein [Sphingobacterium sp. SYP-B4668]
MNTRLEELSFYLSKYVEETISEEELIILSQLINSVSESDLNKAFTAIWDQESESANLPDYFTADSTANILSKILNKEESAKETPHNHSKNHLSLRFVSYSISAACLLMVLGGWWYWSVFFKHKGVDNMSAPEIVEEVRNDRDPGKEEAIFTLDNGEKVSLTGTQPGVLKKGENFEIVRLETGEIQYRGKAAQGPVETHSIQTPRGGQINFVLPDGSRVWLNAASTIHFPSNFNKANRVVELSGEAYFEVVKNHKEPFIVKNRINEIEVLGTKFNVKAYDDENSTVTALLEGSVRVSTNNNAAIMKPNQLATIESNGPIQIQYKKNINQEFSWKDGYFNFDDTDIHTIMNQISRWYNIDIESKESIREKRLTGKISRDVKLSKVLEMLSFSGVHYQQKNGKLIMTDNN